MSILLVQPNEVNGSPAPPEPGPNYLDPVVLMLQVFKHGALPYNSFGGILPEKYDPTGNGAVIVSVKGGLTHPEAPLQKFTLQVRAWTGVNEFALARRVSYSAFSVGHGVLNKDYGEFGFIISLLESTPGIEVVDPDSGWSTVVSTFELLARSN